MHKRTNPLYLLAEVGTFGKSRLLYALRQAPGRPRRWRRQAVRRHPARFRPLTPGERTLHRMRAAADELNSLLEPLRITRPRGHECLRELLHDAQTQPALVAQVNRLSDCLQHLLADYAQERLSLEGWIKEWDHALPERKIYLREVEKSHAISACFRAFTMLGEEAERDLSYIRQMNPEAFAPPPILPFPSKTPTPYS